MERGISFAANVLTIITFFAAIFGKLGVNFLPNYAGPRGRSVVALVIGFAIFSSVGIANFLNERLKQAKPTVLLAVILTIVFCFSTSYIVDLLTQGSSVSSISETKGTAVITASMAFGICILLRYLVPIAYPNGFSLSEWVKRSWTAGPYKAFGLAALLAFLILYLFTLLGLMPSS